MHRLLLVVCLAVWLSVATAVSPLQFVALGHKCEGVHCFTACLEGTCSHRPAGACCDSGCSSGGCCGDFCSVDTDCKLGECDSCIGGRCGKRKPPSPCKTENCGSCPAGTCPSSRGFSKCCGDDCSRSHCYTQQGCSSDSDCRGGETCDDSVGYCLRAREATRCRHFCPHDCRDGCVGPDPSGCCDFTCSAENCARHTCDSNFDCPRVSRVSCDSNTRTCRVKDADCDRVDCFFPECNPGECLHTRPDSCCPECSAEACHKEKCGSDADCEGGDICNLSTGLCDSSDDCRLIACDAPQCGPDECLKNFPGSCCPGCSKDCEGIRVPQVCYLDRDCPEGEACDLNTGYCAPRVQFCAAIPCVAPRCFQQNACLYTPPDQCCPICTISEQACGLHGDRCEQHSDCAPEQTCNRNSGLCEVCLTRCSVPSCRHGECLTTRPGECCPSCSVDACPRTCSSSRDCTSAQWCNPDTNQCEDDCTRIFCDIPVCGAGECLKTNPGDCCPHCSRTGCSNQCNGDRDCTGLGEFCDVLTRQCKTCADILCATPVCGNNECSYVPEGECCARCAPSGSDKCPFQRQCLRDSECRSDEACDPATSQCREKPDCRAVRCGRPECPEGMCEFQDPFQCCLQCSRYACDDFRCQRRSDCPEGYRCRRGECRRRPPSCQRDEDCLDGRCVRRRCRRRSSNVSFDRDDNDDSDGLIFVGDVRSSGN